jgi:uncharacterized membrane protein
VLIMMIAALMLAFGLFVITGLAAATRRLIKTDKLPRNTAFGLRTPKTTSSDAAWRAGHLAAVHLLGSTWVISALGGIATLVAALFSYGDSSIQLVLTVAGIGYGLTIAALVLATIVADRAARAVTE